MDDLDRTFALTAITLLTFALFCATVAFGEPGNHYERSADSAQSLQDHAYQYNSFTTFYDRSAAQAALGHPCSLCDGPRDQYSKNYEQTSDMPQRDIDGSLATHAL